VRPSALELLKERRIQPSAQRLAIAEHVLATESHPSADQVFAAVKETLPMVSRATVYNTLHLLAKKGLVRELTLAEGKVVFDANVEKHHHFVDERTGAIRDVPWEAVRATRVEPPEGYELTEWQVVMRGVKRRAARPR